MAPSRKRKSDEMAEPTTPEASGTPAPKKMRITQTQKQALIDNLQLEITERARHLRAHYALQCADLKSRIERRVNRIPMSMRTVTMGELMEKHNPAPAPPAKPIVVAKSQPAASRQTRKRKSSIVIAADPVQEASKDNDEDTTTVVAKPTALPKARTAKRPGSRTGKTGGVLSPRSHNSRTLPRSPLKMGVSTTNQTNASTTECQPASPTKPNYLNRPLSPLKPASPLKSAAIATTSAITSSVHNMFATAKSTATRAKASSRSQTAAAQRTASQASNHSVASNITTTSTGTVVKGTLTAGTKSMRGRAAANTVAKKTAKDTAPGTVTLPAVEKVATATKSKTGTVRKGAAAMKKAVSATAIAPAEPATTGRRILRKRN